MVTKGSRDALETRNFSCTFGIEFRFIIRPSHTLVTVPTDLFLASVGQDASFCKCGVAELSELVRELFFILEGGVCK